MKKIIVLLIFSWFYLSNSQDFSVMTYNIKLDYPKEGENSWTSRKPFFINQIKFHAPDTFGVQEAMPNQMKEMDILLPQYHFVGVGQDDFKYHFFICVHLD